MEKTFYKVVETLGLKGAKITLLAGDASTRKYYRISYSGGSKILMAGDPFGEDDSNVLSLRAFSQMGVKVPSIDKVFPEQGLVVQEDVGDIHLQLIKDKTKLEKYYKQAIEILIKFQQKAKEYQVANKELHPLKVKFTHEKFLSELNMTTEYYIYGYKNKKLSDKQFERLNLFYKDLVHKMMNQPFLLQHRDYHSRNLMVFNDDLYIIDIQDSRLGPFTYDIASLVIDPYIELDDILYKRIINDYYEGIKGVVKCSRSEYESYYAMCFLQRGVKILGTFAYQKIKKGTDNYLNYIPITVNKLEKVAKVFPKWEETILEDILK